MAAPEDYLKQIGEDLRNAHETRTEDNVWWREWLWMWLLVMVFAGLGLALSTIVPVRS